MLFPSNRGKLDFNSSCIAAKKKIWMMMESINSWESEKCNDEKLLLGMCCWLSMWTWWITTIFGSVVSTKYWMRALTSCKWLQCMLWCDGFNISEHSIQNQSLSTISLSQRFAFVEHIPQYYSWSLTYFEAIRVDAYYCQQVQKPGFDKFSIFSVHVHVICANFPRFQKKNGWWEKRWENLFLGNKKKHNV